MSEGHRWFTRANTLTCTRALAAPLLGWALLHDLRLLAALLFGLAVLTDFADGPVARRYGEVSPLGGLLDHATDALFVSVGLGALAFTGRVPGVLPVLVAAAFLQYAIDSRGRRLRASSLGRWNGIAYYVLLGVPVVRDALALGWPEDAVIRGLGWALVVSTLLSMADRARAQLTDRG
jgi:phosphatidylglycerophosphate synthase